MMNNGSFTAQSKLFKKQDRRRGFTLLESLFALIIFAIAVGAITQTCFNALRALEIARSDENNEKNYRFVVQQIVRIESREDVESGGSVRLVDDRSISWSAEIEETEIVDLFQVTVVLVDEDNREFGKTAEEEGIVETLYLLRPSWSDADERAALIAQKREEQQSSNNSLF